MGGHHNRARRYTEIESGDEPKRALEQAKRKGVNREGLAQCEEVQRKGRSAAVNLDHVQTVEKARLKRFVGAVSPKKMTAVCRALNVATGCTS